MHYEGRSYTGLMRHLILTLIVLGFVAEHTQRLRGEKSGSDGRTGVPGLEPTLCNVVPPTPGYSRTETYERSHPISSTAKQTSNDFTQETAALDV
jgi:hypothetical protein